ncbi:MAG: cupredoxin domain-containing protein [Chloroflexi bacterium]|nr:cupredoxin domain-containing protein [Chloroflexota bacterium]
MNFNFVPETVTVAVGTKITWTDMDESPHTVANLPDHKLFSSDTLRTGTTFSYTATTPGTIQYMCTLHPLMKGTIIVK